MMNEIKQSPFAHSRFWFIGLFVFCVLGFGQSYFLKLFGQEGNFNYYVHFHVVVMFLWIVLLIAQAFLIHTKRNRLHGNIGRLSGILVLMIIVSSILTAHGNTLLPGHVEARGMTVEEALIQPARTMIFFLVPYGLAITNRHKPLIHARYMICTVIPAMIEPPVARLLVSGFRAFGFEGYYSFIAIILSAVISFGFIALIFADRRQKTGRHVFSLMLGLYWTVNIIFIAISTGPAGFIWRGVAGWFLSLPLT
uniref:Cytochrome C and Quinol oxidase polypeptide I n=1 Tax=Candidatus Kentrum sp. DK TaxID=2126562 RepID=A0A450SLA7_9GAMM|nr:MAG: hypothetical protein BECKDK2373C_GA0170839_10438 [Candidatus Kentron sp. DK]